jgi:hypothetical protein
MIEPKPAKKPAASATSRVLPIELRVAIGSSARPPSGQLTGRPFTTAGGKTAHARVRKVDQLDVTEIRSLDAHERVAVKRGEA